MVSVVVAVATVAVVLQQDASSTCDLPLHCLLTQPVNVEQRGDRIGRDEDPGAGDTRTRVKLAMTLMESLIKS
jgi:hypothetical protein